MYYVYPVFAITTKTGGECSGSTLFRIPHSRLFNLPNCVVC